MKKIYAILLAIALNACGLFSSQFPKNVKQLTDGYCILPGSHGNVAKVSGGCIVLGEEFYELEEDVQLAVLAHEVQHVNDIKMGFYPHETRADWFAGCVLGAANIPLSNTVEWMARRNVVDEDHPSSSVRIQAMVQGANACDGRD